MISNDLMTPVAPPLHVDSDGVIRVSRTRVRLETIVTAFENGSAAEAIYMKYPAVPLDDVYSVIAYYLKNRQLLQPYLADRAKLEEENHAEIDRRVPANELRNRLLARKTG